MPKQKQILFDDLEIIIRKRDVDDYASYCPQLLYMIKGKTQIEVKSMMERFLENYISNNTINNNSSLIETNIQLAKKELIDEELVQEKIKKFEMNTTFSADEDESFSENFEDSLNNFSLDENYEDKNINFETIDFNNLEID